MRSLHNQASVLFALVIFSIPSFAWAGISARISPTTVAVGESAQLQITMDSNTPNRSVPRPTVAAPAGLRVEPTGQSSRMSIVNGVMSTSTSFTYQIVASREGTFTFDSIYDGQQRANPVTLTVDNSARSASGRSFAQPGNHQKSALDPQKKSELAFLRLNIPKKTLYAGEAIPITVRGFFRGGTGVTLTGLPEMNTDAYTISGLDSDPSQTKKTIKGQEYLVVTWRGVLTAVKSGNHNLKVTLPATVQYRERSRQTAGSSRRQSLLDQMMNAPFGNRAFGSSLLDDPFLSDPFFGGSPFGQVLGRVVTRDLKLTARGRSMEVKPLPTDGRPRQFRGAVGTFDVDASINNTEMTSGEPETLTITINGKGNFSAVSEVRLSKSDDWNVYAPKVSFEPARALSYRGTKTFKQPIVARSGTVKKIPAIEFTYFDPQSETYVTKTTKSIDVQVRQGESLESDSFTPSKEPDLVDGGDSVLRTIDSRSVSSLAYGGINPTIPLISMFLLAFAIVGALLLYASRTRRWSDMQRRARTHLGARKIRKQMDDAIKADDTQSFFIYARQLAQQRLGAAWSLNPESITEYELQTRWPTAPHKIRDVFRIADQAEYFHSPIEKTDLALWRDDITKELSSPPDRNNGSQSVLPTTQASS